jgi:hypothetical protein
MLYIMRIRVKHAKWALIAGLAFFAVAHMAAMTLQFKTESSAIDSWTRLFDLDQEYNFSSFYSFLILAFSGAIASVLFLRERSISWLGLGTVFIYLSLDEAQLIHEQIAEPLRRSLALGNESLFYHAWVIPAIVITLILGIYLIVTHRKGLISSSANKIIIYVFLMAVGSIMLEIFGSKTYANIVFYRYVTVSAEELYEMGFASLILYNLVKNLRDTQKLKVQRLP